MSNLRKAEAIRSCVNGYYNGFTFTSDLVSKETGYSIKDVSIILSRLKNDKKLLKLKWNKKPTGGKQLVYVKIADIETHILAPSRTGRKSGPKTGSVYVPPDTESACYRFNYGGVLRV